MGERIWITWEDHRRSRILSREFSASYWPLTMDTPRYIKYPVLSFQTLKLLKKQKPGIVFCQNPSIVLAVLLMLFKRVSGYKLIIDRHSNFKFEFMDSINPKWRLFHLLSYLTVRYADLTIVTNRHLQQLCNSWGGKSVILQDKIPDFGSPHTYSAPELMINLNLPQVMFVTMFASDEPIEQIIDASSAMPGVVCYLTGNYRKKFSEGYKQKLLEDNTIFTGYIPESDYLSLMANCNAVVVLTTKDFILNCGAYEALSMRKPLVLSDTEALREYFGDSVCYVNPLSAKAIYMTIKNIIHDDSYIDGRLEQKMETLVKNLDIRWNERFGSINHMIEKV